MNADLQRSILEQLAGLLADNCTAEGSAWLTMSRGKLRQATTEKALFELGIALAQASRKVGRTALDCVFDVPVSGNSPNANARFFVNAQWSPVLWDLSDAARVLLILETLIEKDVRLEDVLNRVYREGDERERGALVKGLSLLDHEGVFLMKAIDIGRTNSVDLFSALALHNPFPACHYSDDAFNQVVLKALFQGLDIGRIWGLDARLNDKLSNMCADYRDERLAAQRAVPESLFRALKH